MVEKLYLQVRHKGSGSDEWTAWSPSVELVDGLSWLNDKAGTSHDDIVEFIDDEGAVSAILDDEETRDEWAQEKHLVAAFAVSEIAMEAVAASEAAWGAILDHDIPGSFEDTEITHEGDRIRFTRQYEDGGTYTIPIKSKVDLSPYTTMKVFAKADTDGDFSARMEAVIEVDGDTVLNVGGDETNFTEREVDVSGYSGLCELSFGKSSNSHGGSNPYFVEFGKFWLEE